MPLNLKNKNDNIHKNEAQESEDDQTNDDKYRVAANVTESHIISKVFFLRIIIPKFIKIRQLLHVKNVCKINK